MKNVKVFRILSTVIFLPLFLLATLATPVQATRGITLSPAEGKIGDLITITGTEFNKSTYNVDKYAAVYFSSDEASTTDDIDEEVSHYKRVKEAVWLDEQGDFETTFRVPDILDDGGKAEIVTTGTYYVYVCHYIGITIQRRIRAVATFTVTESEISLNPYEGLVDTLVEISGKDFIANEDIEIEYDSHETDILDGDDETDRNGEFVSFIRIPESAAGTHDITVIAGSSQVEAEFTVEPDIVLDKQSGEADTQVTVSGTGFGKLKEVIIGFYNAEVATTTTNKLGSFYVTFTVPELHAGPYNMDAKEGANIANAIFTITAPPLLTPPPSEPTPPPESLASISISTTTGNIGQGIIIGGAGFKADSIVTINYDNELLTSVSTDDNGNFEASFTVPTSKYGNHSITASDGINTSEINFSVESIPPPVPTLLLPEIEAKVKSPIRFDWQAVTDISPPITYTIQIATSPDFSVASTVLEKTGLTKTGYSVTEEESLKLGISEKPYYWRVRAIDGAVNEGNWADTEIFYVVSTGMPFWSIITIAIIGAIILFTLGYFINSRTGKSKR